MAESVPISLWLFLAATVVIAVLVNVHFWYADRDGTWHSHRDQMRRLKDGRWEYRRMTDEEDEHKADMEAW